MIRALTCATIAAILLSGVACKNYTGPSLRFSVGYQGAEVGITLYGRKPVSESLKEAGQAFDAIASPYASSGKTHISAPP